MFENVCRKLFSANEFFSYHWWQCMTEPQLVDGIQMVLCHILCYVCWLLLRWQTQEKKLLTSRKILRVETLGKRQKQISNSHAIKIVFYLTSTVWGWLQMWIMRNRIWIFQEILRFFLFACFFFSLELRILFVWSKKETLLWRSSLNLKCYMEFLLGSIESWFHSHSLATPECNPFVTYRVEKERKEHDSFLRYPKSFPHEPYWRWNLQQKHFLRLVNSKERNVLSCLFSPVPLTTLHNFRQVVKTLRFSFTVILSSPFSWTPSNRDAYMFVLQRLMVLQ